MHSATWPGQRYLSYICLGFSKVFTVVWPRLKRPPERMALDTYWIVWWFRSFTWCLRIFKLITLQEAGGGLIPPGRASKRQAPRSSSRFSWTCQGSTTTLEKPTHGPLYVGEHIAPIMAEWVAWILFWVGPLVPHVWAMLVLTDLSLGDVGNICRHITDSALLVLLHGGAWLLVPPLSLDGEPHILMFVCVCFRRARWVYQFNIHPTASSTVSTGATNTKVICSIRMQPCFIRMRPCFIT